MLPLALLLAAAPAPHALDAGPLHVQVVLAETPQLFHAVDQLAGWNPFSHKSYRRWFEAPEHGGLSAEDEALLQRHAALRKRQGYGPLDSALEVAQPLDAALEAAVQAGTLTRADADTEHQVLSHFAPRVRALISLQQPALDHFARGISAAVPALRSYAELASRFFGGTKVDAPVVLVAGPPGSGGGGFNGGKLVVEISELQEPTYVLEHELWHAFAAPHEAELRAAAAEVGTDFETMSEGLAYAVAPGIFRPADGKDALARKVADDAAAHRSFFDEPYVRFNRLGLALRPSLEPALRGGETFAAFLPTEKAVYRGLAEVEAAAAQPAPRCFWFGPKDDEATRRLSADRFDTWSRPLQARFLDELRPKIRPRDVVLLVLGHPESLPAEFAALLGASANALAKARAASPSGELELAGAHGEDLRVLWAPDEATVLQKARRSALLQVAAP